MDSHSTYSRLLAKTITYRVLSILADIIVVFALTGNLAVALTFGTIMVFVSTAIYFAHERVWSGIRWGKNGW